jgi:hypothetical protein
MRETRRWITAALVVLGCAARAEAEAYPKMAPLDRYLIADRSAEIALARSAAPESVSRAATVLVLTRQGYETASQGTNGFVCLVDRAWQAPFADPEFWNPNTRAPVCLNPQAARAMVPIVRRRTEWAIGGLSKAEIQARLDAAFASGELHAPEVGAMSYMMSPRQVLTDADPHFQPHLMYYAPSTMRGADWGANLPGSPVMLAPDSLPDGKREPVLVFVVPVTHWSDGTASAESHAH